MKLKENISPNLKNDYFDDNSLNKNNILSIKIENNDKKKQERISKKKSVQFMKNRKKISTINISSGNNKNIGKLEYQNSMNNGGIVNTEKNLYSRRENQENNNDKKEQIKDVKELNDYEINSLDYKDAIELDKRTYLQYYWSLIKTKHLLIFTFYFDKTKTDYNSYIIKIELFLFAFALYLTVNALFFTDDTIHDIYEDDGIFNFIYNIPQVIYSTVISAVISIIVKALSLTQSQILELKKSKTRIELDFKTIKILKCLKLKFILFYVISLILLSFFWFYISCFCAVYRKTQNHLIKDTLLSFALSMVYPFLLNLLPIILRIPAIRAKNKETMYKISKIVQLI